MLAILRRQNRSSLRNVSRTLSFLAELPSEDRTDKRLHTSLPQKVSFHTSLTSRGLEEFFDKMENWGVEEVKVGRGWRKEELRIKSNEDLHKLWFVLLKERNMLLTMEEEAKRLYKVFPNPERIDKVEESMENLEEVVRERNRAYHLLETGEDGERPPPEAIDLEGTVVRYQKEYPVPKHLNKEYLKDPIHQELDDKQFFRLMREQQIHKETKRINRIKNEVFVTYRKFPNVDVEALQQKYPEVDVRALRFYKKSRGSHGNNFA